MKPISFRSEFIPKILSGEKTQTRRLLKPQPNGLPDGVYCDPYNHNFEHFTFWTKDNKMCLPRGNVKIKGKETAHWKCLYGLPGDRLWVRETWKTQSFSHYTPSSGIEQCDYSIGYKAGFGIYPHCKRIQCEKPKTDAWQKNRDGWRPSIHMPRWASRITLEITNVRVERVQEISEEDARKEGVQKSWAYEMDTPDGIVSYSTFRAGFKGLWNSLYPGSWDRDDWVWVYEFKLVTQERKG